MKSNKRVFLLYGLLACTLGSLIMLSYFLYEYTLTSDMASELMLGKILSDKNCLVTNSWFYSTEIRLLYIAQIASVLFHFLSSWKLVRMVANLILWSILFLSVLYLGKVVHLPKKYLLLAEIMVFLPFSQEAFLYVLVGNFYTLLISFFFLYFALWFHLREEPKITSKRFILCLSALSFLTFINGITSIRGLMSFLTPLLIAEVLTSLLISSKKRITKNNVILIISQFIFGMSAYFVNIRYLVKNYHFMTYQGMTYRASEEFISSIGTLTGMFLDLFGFLDGAKVFSFQGIHNLFSLVLSILFIIWLTILIRHFREYNKTLQYLIIWLFSGMAVVTIITILIDFPSMARYFFPVFYLSIPTFLLWYKTWYRKRFSHILLTILMAFLISGSISTWTGTDLMRDNALKNRSNLLKAHEFIIENDYEFGYGNYWLLNCLTEFTNGEIEGIHTDFTTQTRYQWLAPKKYFDTDYADTKKKFVILKTEENMQLHTWFENLTCPLVYENPDYSVYEVNDLLYDIIKKMKKK